MTDLQKSIVIAFARLNMNIAETARWMHYHRNTLVYHIERIKMLTGLDPQNFFDLIKLYEMAMEEGHADGT